MKGGRLIELTRSPVRVAYLFCVGLFLWCVAQFYQSDTGFSSLISIGELLGESKVTTLRQAPHYVYEKSPGYDGAYYVQIALYPTLDNPELTRAIDNLPYRAKRILFCWAAWTFGFGQPALVVQAHALINVACWLALAGVLLKWFPATSWENFLRWLAVMFSHGVIMSVRHSLVDGPSLLLVALALRWLEENRGKAGAVTLALAGLGKETSLLASAGLDFDWRAPRTWGRVLLAVVLIALPLALWMGYVRWKFGPADDPGMGNFTWPFAGYAERWMTSWREVLAPNAAAIHWTTFGVVGALGAQWLFFALRWRPADRWWRVGAMFALMTAFLATPVWEGYPGASTRVLLPMTLAFNVLLPRGGRWLPLLIAGNLTVAASVFEFSPPHEFYRVRGESDLRAAVRIVAAKGWHGAERHLEHRWRWSSGQAELRLANRGAQAIAVTMTGRAISAEGFRGIRVMLGERMLWGDSVGEGPADMRFGFTAAPGDTVLVFVTDKPAVKIGTDPRDLAFQVANLEIVLKPAGVSR